MNRAARLISRRWLALTLALLVAVTFLSLTKLPAESGGLVARTDWLQHLAAYGALAFPLAFARPRGWQWVLAGLAVWSGAIELVQPLVARATHLSDFTANLYGLMLGTAAALVLRRLTRSASAALRGGGG